MSDQSLREQLVWLVKKWRTRVASSTAANEAVYNSCADDLEYILAPKPIEKSVSCNICEHPCDYTQGVIDWHTHTRMFPVQCATCGSNAPALRGIYCNQACQDSWHGKTTSIPDATGHS